MKYVVFVVLALIGFSFNGEAQQEDKKESEALTRQELMERYHELHDELVRGLTDDNMFNHFQERLGRIFEDLGQMERDMEKDIESIFNRQGSLFERFFDDTGLRRLLEESGAFGQMNDGDFEWIETPDERILIARIELSGAPLDIEIKDGHISFKGEARIEEVNEGPHGVSKSVSVQRINRSFPIPRDCDPDRAVFENEDGKIIVKFPRVQSEQDSSDAGQGQPLRPGQVRGERTI